MTPMNTQEMERRIRQRYFFATSSFSRVYGVGKVTESMQDFCFAWAETHLPAPLEGLHEVDHYFKQLWERFQDFYSTTPSVSGYFASFS